MIGVVKMPEKPVDNAIERVMVEELQNAPFGNEFVWEICRKFLNIAYRVGYAEAIGAELDVSSGYDCRGIKNA